MTHTEELLSLQREYNKADSLKDSLDIYRKILVLLYAEGDDGFIDWPETEENAHV